MLNRALFAVSALVLFSLRAKANLIINPTFDPGVSAQAQAAFLYAAQEYENRFSNPIHVNITVEAGDSGLGGSSTALIGTLDYASTVAALAADATSAADATAFASLGPVDPTGGAGLVFSTAEAKALGLIPDNLATDGVFTYNANLSYTYDPNSRAVPGEYDFSASLSMRSRRLWAEFPVLEIPSARDWARCTCPTICFAIALPEYVA